MPLTELERELFEVSDHEDMNGNKNAHKGNDHLEPNLIKMASSKISGFSSSHQE